MRTMMPPRLVIFGLVFLSRVSLSLGETTTTRFAPNAAFVSKVSPGNVEYVSLKVSEDCGDKLWGDWRSKFASKTHAIHSYDSHENPREALSVIDEAFCFVMQFLPPSLVSKLHQFAFDSQAPCALVIKGLPLLDRSEIPPTPALETIFNPTRQVRCPAAETILLGISRLCGMPHAPPIPRHAQLVRDIVPTQSETRGFLPMHRDYAQQVSPKTWEPELLLLLCVRKGSPEAVAETVVVDNYRLYQSTSEADRQLLRTYRIQKKRENDDGTIVNAGQPFYAIQDNEDGTYDLETSCVTVYNLLPTFDRCDDAQGDAELEQRVLAAYERLSRNAQVLGERVSLEPGDILILNNSRCVHGRTPYQPRLDGTDRWLIKTYVSNGFWTKPSCGNQMDKEAPPAYPRLGFPASYY